ncbi:MAG: response regulator [Bacteroidetes bacterium]|nr:response regulator [Bacteroidota bacterium]
MKRPLSKTLLILLWLFPSLLCSAGQEPVTKPVAKKGIIDLRNQDLSAKPVTLGGEWSFYWNQLLFPDDTVIDDSGFIQYPSLWKNDSVHGNRPSPYGCATYKLTVLLPKNKPALAFQIPDVYCSYAFFVNGKLVAQNGRPGRTAKESKPLWCTKVVNITEQSDTLSLLLQVANYWHAKGGTYKEIIIGRSDLLFLNHQRDIAFDLLLTGCLFMGGLFFLGLYLFGKNDKTILYFSLFCIVYSYRLIGTDIYVINSLFPHFDWLISTKLEYLSLSVGVTFFGLYTWKLYPENTNALFMKITIGFCVLFSSIIILTPPSVFTGLLNTFLIGCFVFTAYSCYIYVQAALHKKAGSAYTLISTAIMMLIFLLINLQYFEIIPETQALIFCCYIAFFFLQSLGLSQRFALSFKKAEEEAQLGLKAKSEFLSTMSHEIRTPLNAVIGMTHLLLSEKPREDQKENLDVLYFSANNLLSIVNNILDYNKIEAGKISFEHIPFDLGTLCSNIITSLRNTAEEKEIDLQLSIDEKLTRKLIGDPTRTSQVINNLVHNAIKFTRKGWVRLSITVNSIEAAEANISVCVEDTGIGIAPEKQQMVFDRFTQADSSTSRSFGGTGLGLAITKKILELQNTTLHLESEPEKGSRFYFTQTFPVSFENAGNKKENMPATNGNAQLLNGLSILLVEDNPLNVIVAQTILEKSGATVDVANNGMEALMAFDAHKHQLVLMDLHMPVMDGYEATKQLRARGEKLPIIALTASTPKEVESDAYAAGITDIVVKPFNPEDLYRVILHYVDIVTAA